MIMFKKGEIDCTMKMQRSYDYIEALEEEHKKIQVFKRELPLCLELVSQEIESCRKELSGSATSEHLHGQSECSERTTSECGGGAVFEEFIPMKWTSSSDENGEPESCEPKNDGAEVIEMESDNKIDKKKSDWLRSVQLWNQSPDPQPKEDGVTKKSTVVEIKHNGGAFHPFQKDKPLALAKPDNPQPLKPIITATPTTSSSTPEASECKKESEQHKQPQTQSLRKQRRCWSPELHRRFLNALQQLGGSRVATPKQIRDLMKVDGLTNDEVKSHLQKYRLHTRSRTPATPVREKLEEAQFMMVKWVPATDVTTNNKIYAPVAVQPPPPSPKRSEERSSGRGRARCNSPANIFFHTNTTSSPLS